MRIAYFTNQYPKVSHSFIRREILALERQGVEIARLALRGWSDPLVDPEDIAEREKTHYLLRQGLGALLPATLQQLLKNPMAFLRAVGMALRLSRLSDRSTPYHLVYLAEACELLQWCHRQKVDHLHVHFGTNPTEVALLARLLGGPAFSFTVHGPDEFDRPSGLHLREKIEMASHVIAISSYGRSQLYRWVGHSHWPKIQVVHCGLETSFHAVEPSLPPNVPRFVCVGRLCEQKGQLLLVQAVARLAQRGRRVELVLAGDGEMRPDIKAMARASGIEPLVRITGWISSSQVREEILAARALVLPSFAEGLPVVIMEAMALRRPVITTFVAGIPELVRQSSEGWLVPAGDVEELTIAMTECLDSTPDALARMADAAHARVLVRHDIDVEASKLVGMFRASTIDGGH